MPPARWEGHCTVVADDDEDPFSPGWLLVYESIGDKTSNECEYAAVIWALEWAERHTRNNYHVITDSEVLVKPRRGRLSVPA
jgi:ribonuclease HI